jgi:hypothetical protein
MDDNEALQPIALPWSKQELWTVNEAACLLSGIEPCAGRAELEAAMTTNAALRLIYRELKDATIKGTIKAIDPFGAWVGNRRVDPKSCIAWATAKGLGIPDKLAQLAEALPAPVGFEFDPDSHTYPEQLDIALIAWRAVSRNYDASRSAKDQIRAWLDKHNPGLSAEAKERIATVCNWKPSGGRPSQKR